MIEEQAFGNTLKADVKQFSSIRSLHWSVPATLQGKQKCHMQADDEYKDTASDLLIGQMIDQTSKQGQAIAK